MAFKLIDMENWERREFYEHFIGEVVCTIGSYIIGRRGWAQWSTIDLAVIVTPR